MSVRLLLLTSALVVSSAVMPAIADEPAPADSNEVAKLAERIDRILSQRWTKENITPAPLAEDAEFLRRVYLDIGGKIPPVSEAREFLNDTSSNKRRKVVDRLLDGPAYITHFTSVWKTVMMPEANADFQVRVLLPGFEAWLRKKLTEDVAYDQIVREILTTPLNARGAINPRQQQGGPTPIAFYQAKQIKAENLAAATARMFLGIRIECAQCHDHPFDTWKREEFWGFAAFFAGIQRSGQGGALGAIRELFDRRDIAIPETDHVVKAAFLDGTPVRFQPSVGSRVTLGEWVISSQNPYFARTAANRLWAHFFGRGLVDPVDDFGAENPPSHPELLDELARAFAGHNFDLKFLIRALTASRAYQLTSRQTDPSQEPAQMFAHMAAKGLTAAQLFDSLAQATGYFRPFNVRNQFVLTGNSPESEFFETFSNQSESPTQQQTTILQALAMMNGQFTSNATNLESSQTLAAIADFPLMNTSERIETLYLASLSRKPRQHELKRLVKYVDSGGPAQDSKQALSDVFWALLNSSEFMLNH